MKKSGFYVLWVLLMIVFSISALNAQKRNNTWVMFSDEGLDLNYAPPRQFYSGLSVHHNTTIAESVAAISSPTTGKLLFYASARTAYNAANQIMPNGDNLTGSTSCTQGALIVPFPGDTNKYYLFTMRETGEGPQALTYSVVDMRLDNGLGDIIPGQRTITLVDYGLSEKMQAVTNGNCDGYWLLVHQMGNSCFMAFDITAAGISAPVMSCIGKVYEQDTYPKQYLGAGAMVISPNGKMVAVVHYDYHDSVYAELFDFNRTTGVVSNQRILWTGFSYGVAFSPDNTKIYTTSLRLPNQPLPAEATANKEYLYQFDLSQGANIDATRFAVDSFGYFSTAGLALGPDGRIYVNTLTDPTVIKSPDQTGEACDYNDRDYVFTDVTPQNSDSNFINNNNFPNYVIEIAPRDSTADLVTDTVVCKGRSVTLDAAVPGTKVWWSNGQTGDSMLVNSSGIYSVQVDYTGCLKVVDTFPVHVIPLPDFYLPHDTTLCAGNSWLINSTAQQMDVKWQSFNQQADTFRIQAPDTYMFNFSNGVCQSSDTVSVSYIGDSSWLVPADTVICAQPLLLTVDAKNATVIWKGETPGNSITIDRSGLYLVDINSLCGNFIDTVKVTSCPAAIFIPNAFSPNGDGNNDVFMIYGDALRTVDLKVFNRWGELVFEGEDTHTGWNGMYNGKIQEPGVYVYQARITFFDGTGTEKKGSVTLIR